MKPRTLAAAVATAALTIGLTTACGGEFEAEDIDVSSATSTASRTSTTSATSTSATPTSTSTAPTTTEPEPDPEPTPSRRAASRPAPTNEFEQELQDFFADFGHDESQDDQYVPADPAPVYEPAPAPEPATAGAITGRTVTPGAWCKDIETGMTGQTVTGLTVTCSKDPGGERSRWRQ